MTRAVCSGWIEIKLPREKQFTRFYATLQGRKLCLFTEEANSQGSTTHVEDSFLLENVKDVEYREGFVRLGRSICSRVTVSFKTSSERKSMKMKIKQSNEEELKRWHRYLHVVALLKIPSDLNLLPGQEQELHDIIKELQDPLPSKSSLRTLPLQIPLGKPRKQSPPPSYTEKDEREEVYLPMNGTRRHISLCGISSFAGKHSATRRNSADPSINWPENPSHAALPPLPPYDESMQAFPRQPVDHSTPSPIEMDDSILHEYYESIHSLFSPPTSSIALPPSPQPPLPPRNRPLPDPTSPRGGINWFPISKETNTLPPTSRPPAPLPKPPSMRHQSPLSRVHSCDQLSMSPTKADERRRISEVLLPRDNHIQLQSERQWKHDVTVVMEAENKEQNNQATTMQSRKWFVNQPINRIQAEKLLNANRKYGNMLMRKRKISGDSSSFAVSILTNDLKQPYKHYVVDQMPREQRYIINLASKTNSSITTLEDVMEFFQTESDGEFVPLSNIDYDTIENPYQFELNSSHTDEYSKSVKGNSRGVIVSL